jgi:hypothetical protein
MCAASGACIIPSSYAEVCSMVGLDALSPKVWPVEVVETCVDTAALKQKDALFQDVWDTWPSIPDVQNRYHHTRGYRPDTDAVLLWGSSSKSVDVLDMDYPTERSITAALQHHLRLTKTPALE